MTSIDRRRSTLAAALLTLTLLAASCTGQKEGRPSPSPAAPMELKVMEFNIEYGGTLVDFGSVVDAIRASGADVVGIEEAWGNIPRLAGALGWNYDIRLQIVSRYPLVDPPGADGIYTFVAVAPGRVVAMGNVHLPSDPYGPFKVLGGAKAEGVLALERNVRLPAVEPSLEALSSLADQDIPVFLTGDFNAPSHLDWTEAVVGTRPAVKYALDWPVSEAVEKAGLHDSYRDVHPDPAQDAGSTWPAARPKVKGWNPGPRAPSDRIDFVYAARPRRPRVGSWGSRAVRRSRCRSRRGRRITEVSCPRSR